MGARNADHLPFAEGQKTQRVIDEEARIRAALRSGPAALQQLAQRTGISVASLTAHLPLMTDAGLIRQATIYRLPE